MKKPDLERGRAFLLHGPDDRPTFGTTTARKLVAAKANLRSRKLRALGPAGAKVGHRQDPM